MTSFSKKLRPILTLSLIGLSSCKTLSVKDAEGCGDLGPYGAHCAHTIKADTRDIPKADWDTLRLGWICMNPDDFNATENTIDEACIKLKCTYEEQQAIKAWYSRIKETNDRAENVRALLQVQGDQQ